MAGSNDVNVYAKTIATTKPTPTFPLLLLTSPKCLAQMTGHRHKHAKLVHHYIPKGACVGNNIREQTHTHTHTELPVQL